MNINFQNQIAPIDLKMCRDRFQDLPLKCKTLFYNILLNLAHWRVEKATAGFVLNCSLKQGHNIVNTAGWNYWQDPVAEDWYELTGVLPGVMPNS